jgi:hypothetical protein
MKLGVFISVTLHDQSLEQALRSARDYGCQMVEMRIEHEDSLFSGTEGMVKAAALLKQVLPREPRASMWWD